MIMLTRLTGTEFALNSDLIERVDATPDTVITLVDGKKYLVLETITEVVAAVRAYRGLLVSQSADPGAGSVVTPAVTPVVTATSQPGPEGRHLAAVLPATRPRLDGEG